MNEIRNARKSGHSDHRLAHRAATNLQDSQIVVRKTGPAFQVQREHFSSPFVAVHQSFEGHLHTSPSHIDETSVGDVT